MAGLINSELLNVAPILKSVQFNNRVLKPGTNLIFLFLAQGLDSGEQVLILKKNTTLSFSF